ncbi:MAG: hypothetical protein PQ964_06435 [Methanobacteriaceae archaeon]
MGESDVVFLKESGQEKRGETKTVIKESYVKFLNRTGGVVEIRFKAPKEDLIDAYHFFSRVNDMESVGMDIAASGERWNHYFRGLSSLVEDEDGKNYKFQVTLQVRDAAPR